MAAAAATVAVRHALVDATHKGFHVKDALRPSPTIVCDSDIVRRGGVEQATGSKGGDGAEGTGSLSAPQDATTFQERARVWIKGPIFETITSAVICFNAMVIGYASSYAMSELQANPDNPMSSNDFITTCGYIFYVFYLGELLLKLAILQSEFWQTADRIWNYFDLLLVLVNTYDMVQEISGDDGGSGGNTTWLRVLRLLKMCKMLRVVRVMKSFRELRLMLYSILASLRMLFWSIIMLGMIMYIFGLVFLQATTDFLAHDDRAPDVATEAYEEVVAYWGGVLPAMNTLYEVITGGNDWAPPGRIVRDAGGIYYFLFLFYISFMTFAVLNVLTGVVVDAAMQVASKDSHDATCHALGEELVHVREAREALHSLDKNATGEIDWETLSNNLHKAEVLAYFETLDIDFAEVEGFFRLLQNRNEHRRVRIDDFLTGCLQMKLWGPAKSVQLVYIMHGLGVLQREVAGVRRILSTCDNRMVKSAYGECDASAASFQIGSEGAMPRKVFAGASSSESENSNKFTGDVNPLHQAFDDFKAPLASLLVEEVMPTLARKFVPQLAEGIVPELTRQISIQITASLDVAVSSIRELLSRLEHDMPSVIGQDGARERLPKASFASVRARGTNRSRERLIIQKTGEDSCSSSVFSRTKSRAVSTAVSAYSANGPVGKSGVVAGSDFIVNASKAGDSPRQCRGLDEWLARHNLQDQYEAMLELAHQQGAHKVEDLLEIQELIIPAALQLKPIQRTRLAKALQDLHSGSTSTADPCEHADERSSEMMDARWQAAVQSIRNGINLEIE